ncbi:hypothetical protein BAL199_27915 [alpha proteobacterium BAL199]|nr:hypothetical protein BAL199_27915 [alpha proteobacterium BAL199]
MIIERKAGDFVRSAAVWLLALAFLCSVLAAGPVQAARPVLDWLDFNERVRSFYTITADPSDTARITARSKGEVPSVERRVLLLIPFASQTAYSISVNAILSTFQERKVPAVFDIWFYDTDLAIASEAVDWAEANAVDLIMPVGSDATEYLHRTYSGGRIPVVTSASKDPVLRGQMPGYHSGSGTNIAYTSNTVPVRLFISYLRELLPKLHTIAVLYDLSNRSAVETQVEPLHAIASEMELTVLDVAVRDGLSARADLTDGMSAVTEALAGFEPEFGTTAWIITGSTSVYREIELINRLGGRMPVIATLPDVVRGGDASAVVSIGVNQSTAVQLAAHYAADVLTGVQAVGTLPVGVVTPPDIAISFRAAGRIGLRIPFRFMEAATFIYDYDGRQVRAFGQRVSPAD